MLVQENTENSLIKKKQVLQCNGSGAFFDLFLINSIERIKKKKCCLIYKNVERQVLMLI